MNAATRDLPAELSPRGSTHERGGGIAPAFWWAIWALTVAVAAGLSVVYAWLPADGATGDLESFSHAGFRVQWLLERREGGLLPGDLIVRAGGHTPDEWLRGTLRPSGWRTGSTVPYEVLREGAPLTLDIRLAPVATTAVLGRWIPQTIIGIAFFLIGTLVLRRRPHEPAACMLMLFCASVALQYWGDAYNIQFSALPWRWPFWLHVALEHASFGLSIASICLFALVFPLVHPWVQRFPRLTPAIMMAVYPLTTLTTMLLSRTPSAALRVSNHVGWGVALCGAAVSVGAAVRSARVARDPLARIQLQWILWATAICASVLIPGYVVPLLVGRRPLVQHPIVMLVMALLPLCLAVAILRFRLLDIQVIIHRSLVYAGLTVLLIGLYMLIVRLLTWAVQRLFHQPGDPAVVFVATLSIALAADPLRRRVQALVDRAFYRTRTDNIRLLSAMSEQIATSMLLEQQAALLTEGLPQRMQLEWADLLILEPDGTLSSLRAGPAGRAPPRRQAAPAPLPQHPSVPLLLALLRTGQPLLRLQLPPHAPAEVQALLDAYQIEVSIPLMVGTRLIGVYNLGPKRSGDPIDFDELRLLHVLGQQAAAAIENGRLFRAERSERELAQALAEAAAVVNSTLELELVLERILEQVERVVGGDAFNIMLVEGDDLRVVRWRGYDRFGAEDVIRGLFVPIAALPPVARMLERGEPVLVEETETDPLWVSLERYGWIRSFVGAPIWLDGHCVGALNVDGARPRQFTWADAARLQVFSHHAAIALKNARLFEQAQHELAERRQAEQQLRHLLREKDVLLREIHHRIKNNLQVVSSMLSLQADRVSDEAALRAFQDSQDRIRSMALIHERLYQTENLTRIAFGDYARGLIKYLQRVYEANARGIALEVRAEEIHLTMDVAVPCGLILNELLSNALKHAYPHGQGGIILVEITQAQPKAVTTPYVVLRVSDDGVGFPPDLDFQRSPTLGLQLVRTLVGQLGGTLALESHHGTRIAVTFPMPAE